VLKHWKDGRKNGADETMSNILNNSNLVILIKHFNWKNNIIHDLSEEYDNNGKVFIAINWNNGICNSVWVRQHQYHS
jgi:antitoxin component YwqK of YwqJK toxin-antitoxin module